MQKITATDAKYLLSFLPKRPGYDTWIKAISAIGNSFPPAIALNILLSHFADESPQEHANKLKYPLDKIGIGTLIHFAQMNGYNSTINSNGKKNNYIYESKSKNRISFIDCRTDNLYKFEDYYFEERAAIYQYDGNMSRQQSEQLIIAQYPEAIKERANRIAINRKVINKSKNYKALTENFENCILTAREIAIEIKLGHAICCAVLKADSKGCIIRKNENWLSSEIFALDIDGGLTIEQVLSMPETETCLILYTTASHSEGKHRFRLIFDLPYLEKNAVRYKKIIEKFIRIFGSDEACKDLCRGYYGNTEAKIYLLRTGEVL